MAKRRTTSPDLKLVMPEEADADASGENDNDAGDSGDHGVTAGHEIEPSDKNSVAASSGEAGETEAVGSGQRRRKSQSTKDANGSGPVGKAGRRSRGGRSDASADGADAAADHDRSNAAPDEVASATTGGTDQEATTPIRDDPNATAPITAGADTAAQTETSETHSDERGNGTPAADGPDVTAVVEAVLFATDSPLTPGNLAQISGCGTARDARKHVARLNQQYEQQGRSFRIEEIAGGYQMLTLPVFNEVLSRLFKIRQESKLSRASLETLAIVAYKQPVLRADVEAIRGVSCGEMLNRLRELNLIKIVGRAEDVGRPILYGTTKKFLEVFGLGSLEDLPSVEELSPPE